MITPNQVKSFEFNTGLALMAVIDQAIKNSPVPLAADTRKLAADHFSDLLSDMFGTAIFDATDAEASEERTWSRDHVRIESHFVTI